MLRFFFCLLMILAPVGARAHQDIGEIKSAIEKFVSEQGIPGEVSVKIGAIDPRLNLPDCKKMDVFAAQGARLMGNSTVGVRCGEMWTIFVPVKIQAMADIVYSARSLSQGSVIQREDLLLKKGDLAQDPSGVLTDINSAVGKTISSSIAGGMPIRSDMLHAPLIIKRGQTVKLVTRGERFTASSEGVALGSAAEGQSVQVKTASGQVVSGTAKAGAIVEVSF